MNILKKIINILRTWPLGLRTIKTGIAVALSMYICNVFNIPHSIFAGSAAVANMKPSVGKSFSNAREQIAVHFISIAIAIFLGLLIKPNSFLMGLAAVIIISICTKLKIKSSLPMGVVAAIFVLGAPHQEFLYNALIRSAVIFIGVGVAVLVNITIAPPQYHFLFLTKILELNQFTTKCFEEAVKDYFNLNNNVYGEWERKNRIFEAKKKEADNLYELYCYEWRLGSDGQDAKRKKIYKKYISFNKGLWQRTKDIHFLTQERIERRRQANNPPISPEYKEIIDLLCEALHILRCNNTMLNKKIKGEKYNAIPEKSVWKKLDPIISTWQDKVGVEKFYLHALIEISLITYKVRWAVKESWNIINN